MNEINKLITLLKTAEIPHEIKDHWEGSKMVCYPVYGKGCICDAVCFPGSYGFHKGLLEIMGLVDVEEIGDEVEGYLTANEVFHRILGHYLSTIRGED